MFYPISKPFFYLFIFLCIFLLFGGNSLAQFTETEVSIPSGPIELAGTLSLPQAAEEGGLPAILIIPGARAWDRNGNIKDGVQYGHYRDIADYLASQGFIVLRYDKRGTGESSGRLPKRDFMLARDSMSAFNWLNEQPQVDKGKIVLLGHSQGTRIAVTIAAKAESLAAAVLLSPVIKAVAANYFKCPVLMVRGERDEDIFQEDVDNVIKAFREAGNTNCRSLLIPGANHLFFDVAEGIPDYNDPLTTVHPELLEEISAWLKEVLHIEN